MPILKEIVLRHRSEGHVRFDLPASLCVPEKTVRLVAELGRVEGVYRVDIYRRQRKLSIRFMPMVVDFKSLSKALGAIAKAIETSSPLSAMGVRNLARGTDAWSKKLNAARPMRWAREKIQEARETVEALKIIFRRMIGQSSPGRDPGDLLIAFLNDVLVLYLIRVHWSLMTRYWLRRPFEYRYQWLSASYLLFLLIRSRQARLR